MKDTLSSDSSFLEKDPSYDRRWQALSLNASVWCERWSQAAGGEIARDAGVMWTYNPRGSEEGAIKLSFIDEMQIGDQMDRILDWYRARHLLHGLVCWYLLSTPPGDLGARMFARGFEPNWQPHWMWLDLRHLRTNHARPADLTIQVVEGEIAWQVDNLPYYSTEDSAILAALHHAHPRHVLHLAAFQGQQVVGRCMLNVTTGEYGIAGLFSMGVVPSVRKQGIGTALVQTAGELAQQMGCHHVFLNATGMGEPVYRRVGFQSMEYGHTWFIRARTLASPAPTHDKVLFMEAIGRGDVTTLDEMSKRLGEEAWRAPLPSRLTPLDIAVHFHQSASAEWLVERGTPLDPLSAWDLGWKERLPALLVEHPELVNLQRGDWQLTPLHIAVEHADIELVKVLLTAPSIDLEIKDTEFAATPLGWARYLQLPEIVTLLEQHNMRKKNLK